MGKDFFYHVYVVKRDSFRPLPMPSEVNHKVVTFTDADMSFLARLPQLRTIELIYCVGDLFDVDYRLTDNGLECLANMKYLETLDLSGNQITDAGLEHLKGLTSLRRLALVNTKVTDAGVAKLRKTLPKCDIHR